MQKCIGINFTLVSLKRYDLLQKIVLTILDTELTDMLMLQTFTIFHFQARTLKKHTKKCHIHKRTLKKHILKSATYIVGRVTRYLAFIYQYQKSSSETHT